MFKRRIKRPILTKFRELLWPSAGWKRAANYMRHRLARINATPYAIASGFACGAAVSLTPFIGLHFLVAALLAWIVRGNILTSAMGTVIGNPWTFPFIWALTYNTGVALLGWEASDNLMSDLEIMFGRFTIVQIVNNPLGVLGPFFETVFLPMLIGGILIGSIAWVLIFWPLFKVVTEYKNKRQKKLRSINKHKKKGQ